MRQGRAPGNRARPFFASGARANRGATAGWPARGSSGSDALLRRARGGCRVAVAGIRGMGGGDAGLRCGRRCAVPSPPARFAWQGGFCALGRPARRPLWCGVLGDSRRAEIVRFGAQRCEFMRAVVPPPHLPANTNGFYALMRWALRTGRRGPRDGRRGDFVMQFYAPWLCSSSLCEARWNVGGAEILFVKLEI